MILACLFLAEFGAGFGLMMLDISVGAIFAAVIPAQLRSRVSGAYMVVNYGVRPLGALVGGALGTWIGLRETLWLASAGALLGVLWLLPSPLFASCRELVGAEIPRRAQTAARARPIRSGRGDVRLSTASLTSSAASFVLSQASSALSFAFPHAP